VNGYKQTDRQTKNKQTNKNQQTNKQRNKPPTSYSNVLTFPEPISPLASAWWVYKVWSCPAERDRMAHRVSKAWRVTGYCAAAGTVSHILDAVSPEQLVNTKWRSINAFHFLRSDSKSTICPICMREEKLLIISQ